MAFVEYLKIGTKVELVSEDLEGETGIFTKGHRFTITEMSSPGFYNVVDSEGRIAVGKTCSRFMVIKEAAAKPKRKAK